MSADAQTTKGNPVKHTARDPETGRFVNELDQWLAQQSKEFMKPVACYFDETEAREYCTDPDDLLLSDDDQPGAGWYSRLSAPGYLDCTDWSGPHDTERAALQALFDMYGE